MHPAADTPTQAPAAATHGGPRFNALKHALYSKAILLPGEDAAEFQRRRRALFHNFRPQTIDEAELVDAIAENRWLLHRTRPLVAAFDAQTAAPDTDAAGRLCEPAGHTRLHSTMDVGVHRQRLSRAIARDRANLYEAQRLRRQGLIDGAVKLPKDCYMEVTGQILGPIAPHGRTPALEPEIETTMACQVVPAERGEPAAAAPTGSDHGPSANSEEQQETGAVAATGRVAMHPLPRRPGARGRLIGGVGVRRIYLEPLKPPLEEKDVA